MSKRSRSAVSPAGVSRTARSLPIRRTQLFSWKIKQICAPARPARWDRRSVQSKQALAIGRAVGPQRGAVRAEGAGQPGQALVGEREKPALWSSRPAEVMPSAIATPSRPARWS